MTKYEILRKYQLIGVGNENTTPCRDCDAAELCKRITDSEDVFTNPFAQLCLTGVAIGSTGIFKLKERTDNE